MTPAQFLELAVSLSLQVSLVVIVVHWLGHLTNSEQIQCRLWTGCYVTILCLIVVALTLPHPRMYHPWSSIPATSAVHFVTVESQLGKVLLVVWLCGVVVSAMSFVVRTYKASKFLQTCQPIDASVDFEELSNEVSPLSVGSPGRKVNMLSSPHISTPFCWQFHQPYIVLPEFVLGFGQRELGFIVRHELEHLQTGHPLQLFLQRLIEGIFWFHPLVWWAARHASESREYACDEAAIDSPAEIATYLKTLLTIVEYQAADLDKTPTPLAFGRGCNIVVKRAQRLTRIATQANCDHRRRLSAPSAIASLCVAALTISFAWLPVDVLASPRANWSPWPTWTAGVLKDFGVSARDYDVYDDRVKLHELLENEPDDEDRPRSY